VTEASKGHVFYGIFFLLLLLYPHWHSSMHSLAISASFPLDTAAGTWSWHSPFFSGDVWIRGYCFLVLYTPSFERSVVGVRT